MEIFKIISETIVGISWPLMIGFVVFWFRKDIRKIIPRVRRAGPTGLEFEGFREQLNIAREVTEIEDLKEFPSLPRTQFMATLEKSFFDHLKNIKDDDQIDLLVIHLAQTRIQLFCEQSLTIIFGSQIACLGKLNDSGGKISIDSAHQFFEDVKENDSEFYKDATFEQWFKYLQTEDFAFIEENYVNLTDLGQDFLAYVEGRNLTGLRPH